MPLFSLVIDPAANRTKFATGSLYLEMIRWLNI